jgi:hypothetical protein
MPQAKDAHTTQDPNASPETDTARRTILAGLATMAAGAAVPARAAMPSDDVELIALGRQISVHRVRERDAYAEVARCGEIFDQIKPEKPYVLLWRRLDPAFLPPNFQAPAVVVGGAEHWWIDERVALQDHKYGIIPLAASAGDFERRAEAVNAWHEWQHGLDKARQDSGLAVAEERANGVSAETSGVLERMLELKPMTLDGYRAIASAIVQNCGSDDIEAGRCRDERGITLLLSNLTGMEASD